MLKSSEIEIPVKWRSWVKVLKRETVDGPVIGTEFKSGNILTYTGASAIWECLLGNGAGIGGYFTNAGALIGVGTDGSRPNDPSVTGLLGTTAYHGMDSTYPLHIDTGLSSTGGFCFFRATFGTSDGNFAWNEIGVFNASHRILNRYPVFFGTKAYGFWTVIIGLQISN